MEEVLINSEKIGDYEEKDVRLKIDIGSIVANLAHPFDIKNTNVLITAYSHHTPPLMIVVEKNYGSSYSATTGEKENSSYKCLYYSTLNGSFECYWFKSRELKLINAGDLDLLNKYKNNFLNEIKKELLGKMAILSTVDLELGKKKIWSDSEGEKERTKKNNLLDYLPPLGSIIDVKINEDHQKHNEKDGKVIYKKSKLIVKLRWLNNITSKYSEQDIPLSTLKQVINEYFNYSKEFHYFYNENVKLESNEQLRILKIPVTFKEVVWKHYYYIYRFRDLFTGNIIEVQESDREKKISQLDSISPSEIKAVFDGNDLQYNGISNVFNLNKKVEVEKKWFEIFYSDVNEKYTKRIIYVNELLEEDTEDEKKKLLLKANCLLRKGEIRHFRVGRIRAYRELDENFEKTFVSK
jgi:hypothetical protein